MLHVTEITKRYGHLAALSEVSFSIRPGEVLGVIGPNGSGKTTLFECLGGVLPADGGAVVAAAGPLSPRDRSARLFYLPDAIAPWPAQTVRWALAFIVGFFRDGPPEGGPSVREMNRARPVEPQKHVGSGFSRLSACGRRPSVRASLRPRSCSPLSEFVSWPATGRAAR